MNTTGVTGMPAPRGGRGRAMLYPVLALLAMLAAYSNHFENSFHYDDVSVIVDNVYIRSLNNIPQFFRQATTLTTVPTAAAYRPLASVSFALDYWWGGGLNVAAFHCTQFACHLLICLLAGLLLRALLLRGGAASWAGPLALFGAAFYGLHLAHTEILNIITLRSEMLATLGALGSLCAYEFFPRGRRTGLWLLPMIAGAFAKPTALMLAPLLAGYLMLIPPPDRDGLPAAVATRIKHGLVAFTLATALYLMQDRMGGSSLSYGYTPRGVYLQTQLFAWLHYLRIYLLPLGLSVDYNWPSIDFWYDTRVLLGALFNGLLLCAALGYARVKPRPGRLFLLGVLWFYLALAPSSSFIPLPDMVNTYRAYFSYIGLTLGTCVLAAEYLHWTQRTGRTRWRSGLLIAGALALGAHAIGVYRRNRDFRDEKSLWTSVVRLDPGNPRGWSQMGILYAQEGQFKEARSSFTRTLKLLPGQHLPYLNLASLDLAEGHFNEAEADFKQALALSPNQPDTYVSYSVLLKRLNRNTEGIEALEKAFQLAPADFQVRLRLMDEYLAAGDTPAFCRLGADTRRLMADPAIERELIKHCSVQSR